MSKRHLESALRILNAAPCASSRRLRLRYWRGINAKLAQRWRKELPVGGKWSAPVAPTMPRLPRTLDGKIRAKTAKNRQFVRFTGANWRKLLAQGWRKKATRRATKNTKMKPAQIIRLQHVNGNIRFGTVAGCNGTTARVQWIAGQSEGVDITIATQASWLGAWKVLPNAKRTPEQRAADRTLLAAAR